MYYQGRGYTFNPDTELRNNISSEDAMLSIQAFAYYPVVDILKRMPRENKIIS